jgi:hypothetical protein
MKALIHTIKKFLGIKLNMEEIKTQIKSQILIQIPAFEVEFFEMNSPTKENYMRILINCHFQDEYVKILDLLKQGKSHLSTNLERIKIFSRINSAKAFIISLPFFSKYSNFDCIGISFFLHYPEQGCNNPIRLYGVTIMLDEIERKRFTDYRELFPYFRYENSHIENLLPRFPSKKRLSVDCCDATE